MSVAQLDLGILVPHRVARESSSEDTAQTPGTQKERLARAGLVSEPDLHARIFQGCTSPLWSPFLQMDVERKSPKHKNCIPYPNRNLSSAY